MKACITHEGYHRFNADFPSSCSCDILLYHPFQALVQVHITHRTTMVSQVPTVEIPAPSAERGIERIRTVPRT